MASPGKRPVDGVGVVQCAQHPHVRQVQRCVGEVAGFHTGGDDQPIEAQVFTTRQDEMPLVEVEPEDPAAQAPRRIHVGVGAQRKIVSRHLAGEKAFRQRCPVVGAVGFVADDHYLAGVAVLAEPFGSRQPGRSGPGDDDPMSGIHRRRSVRVMAWVGQHRAA
jgi:hypothetical protein